MTEAPHSSAGDETTETVVEQPGSSSPAPKANLKAKVTKHANRVRNLSKRGKLIVAGVVAAVVVVAATPLGYPILNMVTSTKATVTVIDSETSQPIFEAHVDIGGVAGETDENGQVTLTGLKFGSQVMQITKEVYDTGVNPDVSLGLGDNNLGEQKLTSNGTAVALSVVNKINGVAAASVNVSLGESTAATDAEGNVSLIIPKTTDKTVQITLGGEGYTDTKATVEVKPESSDPQRVGVTPAGTVYFLSKRTGRINVMKSNLDGTGRQVVLKGTGKEDDGDTVLLASRDWKYLLLKSTREHKGTASLYLIDTATDKMVVVDEGSADFTPVGWDEHNFVYQVSRRGVKPWTVGRNSLKTYNADSQQITIIASSRASGTSSHDGRYEYVSNPVIVGDKLFYTTGWDSNNYAISMHGYENAMHAVNPDGTDDETLLSFDAGFYNNSYDLTLTKPRELYIRRYGSNYKYTYYEYNGEELEQIGKIDDEEFYYSANKTTYLLSPAGDKTFWVESRDGKDSLLIGDTSGHLGKTIASLEDFNAYGWYGDDYILASRKSSELYILGVNGLKGGLHPVKITDYHKPDQNFYGYGGGYGGN